MEKKTLTIVVEYVQYEADWNRRATKVLVNGEIVNKYDAVAELTKTVSQVSSTGD